MDAWSRDFQPQNYPVDTDTSNSGFVYYVYRDMGTEYGVIPPVDESEYLQWREEYLAGAAELELLWQSRTAEQFQTLTAAGLGGNGPELSHLPRLRRYTDRRTSLAPLERRS